MPRSIRRSSILVACLLGGAIWLPSATPGAAPKGSNRRPARRPPSRRTPTLSCHGDGAARTGLDGRRPGRLGGRHRRHPRAHRPAHGGGQDLCRRQGFQADHRAHEGPPRKREAARRAHREAIAETAAHRRRGARHHPRGGEQAHRARVEAIGDPRWLHLLPATEGADLRQAHHRQRHRRAFEQVPGPERAAARLDGLEGNWPARSAPGSSSW